MKPGSVQRMGTTLTFLANGFGLGVWSVEIAGVRTVTGASDIALGAALLVFALAALAAMQVSGRLSARYPANRVCAGFGLAFAASLATLGFMPGMSMLIAALACFGMAHGALDVAMNARASVLENRAGRPMMSSFHAAWSIGGAAGAAFAGLLTSQGMGPDIALPAAGAVVLPGLMAAFAGYQPPAGRRATAPAASKIVAGAMSARLILLCAIAFLALFTEGAIANWSSIYLQHVLAGMSGGFAIGYVAFSGGMSIGRISGDRVVARCGRRRIGALGALIAAAAFAAVLVYPTYLSACVGFALIGVGLSNIVPITFSIAGRAARSEASGIARTASAGYTGFVVGPPLIGGVAHLSTLPVALNLLIASTASIALLGAWVFRPLRTDQ